MTSLARMSVTVPRKNEVLLAQIHRHKDVALFCAVLSITDARKLAKDLQEAALASRARPKKEPPGGGADVQRA